MALEKPLASLTERDLQDLISNGVSERRTIEYKRSLPESTDEAKKEFLADVSSFANAVGGSLIYGMEEANGLPIAVNGLKILNADDEKLRLENIIRDGIAPRIIGVELSEPIPISAGGAAFVIRIPQSWNSPHMVTFKRHSKFYSRNSAGKYPLNVEELRAAFAFSDTTRERLRDFRAERLSKIVASLTPVKLPTGPSVVLHVIPLSAFESVTRFDASELTRRLDLRLVQPIFTETANNAQVNFDGYLVFEQTKLNEPAWAYAQVFRNGSIETVNASIFYREEKLIPSVEFEGRLLRDSIPRYLTTLKKLGIQPPVFLGLSLLGVLGYAMEVTRPPYVSFSRGTNPFDRDSFILPDAIVETFETGLDAILKPAFDSIWNAVGRTDSPYYRGLEWLGLNVFSRQ